MRHTIPFYIIFCCTFLTFSCALLKAPQKEEKKTQHVKPNLLYTLTNKKCSDFKQGEIVVLQLQAIDIEGAIIQDSIFSVSKGNVQNPYYLNDLLKKMSYCDSLLVDPLPLKDFFTAKDVNYISIVPLTVAQSWNKAEEVFFKELEKNPSLSKNVIAPGNFKPLEYGDQLIYQKIKLYPNHNWEVFKQDTLVYNLANLIFLIQKWELQNFSKYFVYEERLNEDTSKTAGVNFVYVDTVIYQKSQLPQVNHDFDTLNWQKIKEDLWYKVLHKSNQDTIKAKVGKWIKVNYSIKNIQDELLLESDEPYFFYLGENEIPKAWNMVLKNACVGDQIKVKSDAKYAYGKDGLYPIVKANQDVFFYFEVLGVQE